MDLALGRWTRFKAAKAIKEMGGEAKPIVSDLLTVVAHHLTDPALKGLHASTEVVWIADQPGGQQKFGLRILAMH